MKCSKCSKELSDESLFCNHCGQPVQVDATCEEAEIKSSINVLIDQEKDNTESDDYILNEVVNCNFNTLLTKNKNSIRDKVLKNKAIIFILPIIVISIIIIGNITDFTFSYKYCQLKKYNEQDINGNTYLMKYIKEENTLKAKELIAKGVDLKSINNDKDDALLLATKLGNKDIVEELLKKEVELNSIDNERKTALLISIKNKNYDITKLLIEAGANVEIIDIDENTALHLAVKNGDKELVELLINKGANVNRIDLNKDTPLLLTAKLKKGDIMDILIKNGADVTRRDINNNSVLDICAEAKDEKMFKLCIADGKDRIIEIYMQQEEFSGKHAPSDEYIKILVKNEKLYDFFMVEGKKALIDSEGFKRYEGEIKGGKINGYGVAYSGDGKNTYEDNQIMYAGNWKNGLWNGKGESYWIKRSIQTLKSAVNSGIFKNEAEANNFYAKDKNTVFYDTTYENGYRVGNYTRYYQDGTLNDTGTSSYSKNDSNKYGQYNATTKKNPTIGMTAEEVKNSLWGKPNSINRTTTADCISEQWVYSNYRYIYLDNGIVTSIQERR